MKATVYRNVILREGLNPFVQENYLDHHRFEQDNDPNHPDRADDCTSYLPINTSASFVLITVPHTYMYLQAPAYLSSM